MNKKLTLILSLVVLFCLLHVRHKLVEVKAPNGYPVNNLNTGLNYTTIQGAIDAPETVNGNTIFVQSGVYYEKVLVDKGISLIGQDRDRTIIDGNSSEGGVHITGDSVMLNNFTVRNCRNHGINSAIYLDQADCCEVIGNVIASSSGGILLSYSEASNVSGNLIDRDDFAFGVFGRELGEFMHSIDTSNLVNGKAIYYLVNQSDLVVNPLTFPQVGYLALVNSKNVVVENLTLKNNWQGLLLAYVNHSRIVGNRVLDSGVGMVLSESLNNSVLNNVASSNGHGIGVVGSGISLDHSQGNTIATNLVTGNYVGINPAWSSNNSICHNNIMGNIKQIYAYSSMDLWNSDYPSGGNYWSDYNGTDSDQDGIGDTPYVIDANNTDNYPLMGMFYSINITFLPGSTVTLISNSTISFFNVVTAIESIEPETSKGIPTIFINFTDQAGFGFCRVSIPQALMNISNTPVTIDHGFTTVLTPNYMLYDNGTQRWIYFAYEQSPPLLNQTSHLWARIMIIPEFPSFLVPSLFIILTLLAVIVYKRKRTLSLHSFSDFER